MPWRCPPWKTTYYPRTDGNLYSWFSKSTSNQEADTQPSAALSREDCFFIPSVVYFCFFFFFSPINEPRECKLIRYCIWDARMCGHTGHPYWIPWLETGITRRSRRVESRSLGGGVKKRRAKGAEGSFLAVAFSLPPVCYRRRFVDERK